MADEVLNYTTDVENIYDMDTSRDATDSRQNGQLTMGSTRTAKIGHDLKGMAVETVTYPQGLSYSEAVNVGLVDPTSGKLRDPMSGKLMTLQEAMEEGIINPVAPALVGTAGKRTVSLQEAFRSGLVDPTSGKVNYQRCKAQKLMISPNMSTQFKSPCPLNLLDILQSGLFHQDSNQILEPLSGSNMSLQDAVNKNIIDGNLVTITDSATGKRVSLKHALRQGLIDGRTARVKDTATGKTMSLPEAARQGFLQNALDEENGFVIGKFIVKFLHVPLTGKYIHPWKLELLNLRCYSNCSKIFYVRAAKF